MKLDKHNNFVNRNDIDSMILWFYDFNDNYFDNKFLALVWHQLFSLASDSHQNLLQMIRLKYDKIVFKVRKSKENFD